MSEQFERAEQILRRIGWQQLRAIPKRAGPDAVREVIEGCEAYGNQWLAATGNAVEGRTFKLPPLPEHPTTRIKKPPVMRGLGTMSAKVDVEIVPLIRSIWWDHAWLTWGSCQDNSGYVWIGFGAGCATQFLEHVAAHIEGEDPTGQPLRDRVRDVFDWSTPDDREDLAVLRERNPDGWLYSDNGAHNASVRFPRHHLPRVLAAVRRVT